MARKLTDVFVRRATRAGITWDAATTGLGLKVLPSGKKVWIMQLVWPGYDKQSKRNIGHYPAMSLEGGARERSEDLYAAAKSGIDLFKVEEEQRAAAERELAARAENTFGAVAERYIKARTNRRAEADAREIRRMLIAEWRDRPIHEITPRDVRQLIGKIKNRAPYDARNGWGHLSTLFRWAVHEELIEVAPTASLDKRLLFKDAEIKPRQRVLNDDEVFAFWRSSGRLGYPIGPIYRLLLLTGCRVNEIVQARWSELHPELRKVLRDAAKKDEHINWAAVPDDHKILTIPRERFKSDAEHVVQLTDEACRVLEGVPRLAGNDHIFTITGGGPLWLNAKFKQRLDARMLQTLRALAKRRGDNPDQVRIEHWVQHDLRRVVRTRLSAIGIDDHIGEMVIGHGRRGLQRVYDQHKYEPQIRDALERWAVRLREIVEPAPTAPPADPGKVVPFRSKKA